MVLGMGVGWGQQCCQEARMDLGGLPEEVTFALTMQRDGRALL